METPSIYVVTYAKYNSGSLEGAWLDLTDYSSKEEFYEACAELHKNEHDPEYMFQDYENIPEAFVGESWISGKFWEYLEAMEDIHNEEAFQLYVENMSYDLANTDIAEIVEGFEDAYQGEYKDEEDFAYELMEETGSLSQLPENLRYYFDYEKFARDLFMSDYYMLDGHVFRNL